MLKWEKLFSSQESSPEVSVIVPAFNGKRTILQTLSSIINQEYPSLQLIVVDDGSKDSTASFVKDFIGENGFSSKFNMVRHETNLGLSRSLNDGIEMAIGKFVLILHQDCELAIENWIQRAVALAKNEVAVVTGYYGISDMKDDSFVKRSFGVLRKQFHSRSKCSCEEATFSEGKCDLYRKNLLAEIGGFPTNYRIAGEDLIVSYKLRSLGYSIIKCYDLPVIQRFGGTAESFRGNLGKEFLFGKVMGGIFSEFKSFIFKGVKPNSQNYSSSRSLHRSSQPIFVFTLLMALLSTLFTAWSLYLVVGLLFFRFVYYFLKVFSELKIYNNPVNHPYPESIVTSVIGILSDFAYSFGFFYGLLLYAIKKRL